MSPQARSRTRWLLAGIWGFALGGLGLFFPFYSLYLREVIGLSGTAVGAVMATAPLMGLIAQPLWGGVADRTGARTRTLGFVALGTAAGYTALAWPTHFTGLLLGTAMLALFSTALLPSCMSVSLAVLPDGDTRSLGRVRVVGTLGYGVTVGLLPVALRFFSEHHTADEALAHLHIIFPLAGGSVAIAALISLALPVSTRASLRAERGDWRQLLENRAFLRILAFTFTTYLFSQGAMVLFPILVTAHGGGIEAISEMWLIMLALEVPLVFVFGASVSRLGPRGVIAIGTLAAGVRWTASGWLTDLDLVYAAQVLHGVTVWGIILGVPLYVDRVVPEKLRATAQGVLAMIGISFGSILSNLGAGWLTEHYGPLTPARVAGVASCLLVLVLAWVVPPLGAQRPEDER